MSTEDFVWIASDTELLAFCEQLRQVWSPGDRAFIDTEADSLHHYQEKLCLIQLNIAGRHALIDPLSIDSISPLLDLLNQSELWLHGADYDLSLLKRTYSWAPPRIYDTQIGARLLGHRAFGLAALVKHFSGVELCKGSQKEDWSQRPLPAKMLRYAVDDVRYLPELADKISRELAALHRTEWFIESCDTLCRDVYQRQARDREECWRISGSGKFRPNGLMILKAMWHWRDAIAHERDVPPFRILNNQQMLTMAADWERFGTIQIPERWRGKWRTTFAEMMEAVKKSDASTWPERPKRMHRRSTDEERESIDELCKSRDMKAETVGIESSLLGSRSLMEEIVMQKVNPAERLMRWQLSVLGDVLSMPQQATLF